MKDFKQEEYKIFDLFANQWALVTAGTMDDFNTCTVSWGSLGSLWNQLPTATVYIHPARFTQEFMEKYDIFTITFFGPEHKKALGYIGSRSGRNEDKVSNAGLTPMPIGDGVTFKEATKTFVCRKLMGQQIDVNALSEDIKATYAAGKLVYTVQGKDEWEPHYMYIGEVIDVQ